MENGTIVVKEKYIKTHDGLIIKLYTTDDWKSYTVEETALKDFPTVITDWNSYSWPIDERKE